MSGSVKRAIVPVIISGGAGSRLWPLSRESHPKPFIELKDGTTLIGRTWNRAAMLDGVEEIYTVTNRDFLFITIDAYAADSAQTRRNTFLLEPAGRDTTAAIAVAAIHAMKVSGPETILLILPADHLIADEPAFAKAVARAVEKAEAGRIVTFGIRPAYPETGFGYIEVHGDSVVRFVEKPDPVTAERYLSGGRHLWNSGMFCFRAGVVIDAMRQYCPEILDGAKAALEAATDGNVGTGTTRELAAEPFCLTPSISFDFAVLEKASNLACVPVSCGWSDIGSWAAMSQLVEADADGNRRTGETILDSATNCYVHATNRLVSLVGVSDLLVVDTPDALLVAHRDKAQSVRDVYTRLKAADHSAAKLHTTAHRPWGTYTVLEEGERFKIKRIVVKPGHRLSLQSHSHRSEHWVVVSGTAKVRNNDCEILLTTNQSTYIPCRHLHRLENPGTLPLVLIEVQCGDYLGEDDIVRYDDVYGRN